MGVLFFVGNESSDVCLSHCCSLGVYTYITHTHIYIYIIHALPLLYLMKPLRAVSWTAPGALYLLGWAWDLHTMRPHLIEGKPYIHELPSVLEWSRWHAQTFATFKTGHIFSMFHQCLSYHLVKPWVFHHPVCSAGLFFVLIVFRKGKDHMNVTGQKMWPLSTASTSQLGRTSSTCCCHGCIKPCP